MTDVTTELAKLTASTTELTNTVVGKYAALDSKVAAASDSASGAATSEANAAQSVVDAQKVVDVASSDLSAITAADRVATAASVTAAGAHVTSAQQAKAAAEAARVGAETAEANAVAVVSGGTASTTASAGKIPMADADGVIDGDWLPAVSTVAMREVEFEAMRAANNEQFAASGFVHFGKHYTNTTDDIRAINQGLWSSPYPANQNALNAGTTWNGVSSATATSKSDSPIVNIAGVVSDLDLLNHAIPRGKTTYKFPEAPNGTVTYDSATGEIFDYANEVDPKYGDVAPDTNEAVARAFEGHVKNGDFRNADISDWRLSSAGIIEHEVDALKVTVTSASAVLTFDRLTQLVAGKTYTVEFDYKHETGTTPTISKLGIGSGSGSDWGGSHLFTSSVVVGEYVHISIDFTYPSGASNYAKLNFLAYENDVIFIKNLSVRRTTAEVVTNRVDMYGLEQFHREIKLGDFVYPNGLIQSQANFIEGITCTDEAARPDSFFAVFDGDTTSRGKGVDFHALSSADQAKILSNPKHNIYVTDDGKVIQVCIRQRTVAGAGNGDWGNVESNQWIDSGANSLRYASELNKNISVQGKLDEPQIGTSTPAYNSGGFFGKNRYDPEYGTDFGILHSRYGHESDNSYRAHFLVLGVVSRLNQGAYHPSLNPMGTKCMGDGIGAGNERGWYAKGALVPSTLSDCFIGHFSGGVAAIRGDSGAIGGLSGRPDGRFYNAIYASGQGGVCDYRMSAWDASSPDKAREVFESVKTGNYRGRETLSKVEWVTLNNPIVLNSRVLSINSGARYIIIYHQDIPADDIWHHPNGDTSDTTRLKALYIYGDNGNAMEWRCETLFGTSKLNGGRIREGYSARSTLIYSPDASPAKVAEFNDKFPVGTEIKFGFLYEVDTTIEGKFTHIDVIGDPANIMQCEALKDGWIGSWIPELPDGTAIDYLLSRKNVGPQAITYQLSDDNGTTWSSVEKNSDVTGNKLRIDLYSENNLAVVNYTAFANQTKESSNLSLFRGETALCDVFATSHASDGLGCLLQESLLSRVGKSTSNYVIGSAPLQKVGVVTASGAFHTASTLLPSHGEFSQNGYGTSGDSHAVKILPYRVESNDQVNLNLLYNEMIWGGSDWGDDSHIKVFNGQSTYTNDNGDTCQYGAHKLAIPYGWIKNDK